jgi:hypothetical protein
LPRNHPYALPGRARISRIFLAGDCLEFPEMKAEAATGLEAVREVRRQLGAV